MTHYKARLIAKGRTSVWRGLLGEICSYSEAQHSTGNYFHCSIIGWRLHHVKNVCLHGDLQEKVYASPLLGFIHQGEKHKVCQLKKVLYSLKQSPRAWFGKVSATLSQKGFKRSNLDQTVFVKCQEQGIFILCVYMDDIVVAGEDENTIAELEGFGTPLEVSKKVWHIIDLS